MKNFKNLLLLTVGFVLILSFTTISNNDKNNNIVPTERFSENFELINFPLTNVNHYKELKDFKTVKKLINAKRINLILKESKIFSEDFALYLYTEENCGGSVTQTTYNQLEGINMEFFLSFRVDNPGTTCINF